MESSLTGNPFGGRLHRTSSMIAITDKLRYLIFFVTQRCHLRCEHCFYWKEVANPGSELSLEEIDRLTRQMDHLTFLRLTGGEPYIRHDLPEIVGCFYRNARLRNAGAITNGLVLKHTEEITDRICSDYPDLQLDVGVSIDDLQEGHDKVRQFKGSYDKALESVEILKRLRKKHDNLRVSTVTTVTAGNQDHLEAIFDVLKALDIDYLSVNVARNEAKDKTLLDVDMARYRAFAKEVDDYNTRRAHTWGDKIRRAKGRISHEFIDRTIAEKRAITPCLAGTVAAVLHPNGDVYPCEVLPDPAGNIKDFDYDMRQLWSSEEMRNKRDWIIGTGCHCTHECFMTVSVLFNPRHYPRLMKMAVGVE